MTNPKITLTQGKTTKTVDLYSDAGFELMAELWNKVAFHNRLMYQPTWLGIPIIQYPDDIVMMQELIWKVRPDVIIETGVAHGGSAVFYASILELLGKGRVIGVDIEIRQYNKAAIKSHPLSKRIQLIEGSSVDEDVIRKVKEMIGDKDKVLVTLDSNHTYEHVSREIEMYSQFVSPDSYLVVMDGIQKALWDVPSGKEAWLNDNPLDAIEGFLKRHREWQADEHYARLKVTTNPSGFLTRPVK